MYDLLLDGVNSHKRNSFYDAGEVHVLKKTKIVFFDHFRFIVDVHFSARGQVSCND